MEKNREFKMPLSEENQAWVAFNMIPTPAEIEQLKKYLDVLPTRIVGEIRHSAVCECQRCLNAQ